MGEIDYGPDAATWRRRAQEAEAEVARLREQVVRRAPVVPVSSAREEAMIAALAAASRLVAAATEPDVSRRSESLTTKRMRDLARRLDALGKIDADTELAEPPAGMVRVRIAVVVDADGEWGATGAVHYDDETAAASASRRTPSASPFVMQRLSWVEAWVPRPEDPAVIEGEVRDGE